MRELYSRLGVNQDVQVEDFVKQAVQHPEILAETWSNFIKEASYNAGTRAHVALANLARTKGCAILTENIDLLQENVGSKAIHISGEWLRDNVSPDDLKQIDAVITIGLNSDNRGFLNWYKKYNPNGKIIAIQIAQPPYLGDEDYLGPVQK